MKLPLFEFPSFIYQIDDWEFKKKSLLARINKSEFVRTDLQHFETDRQTNGKTYVRYLEEFLKPQLMQFCEEAKVSCSISDAWCVKYQKGDHQTTHNHRGWGFSGLIHVEFDPEVHQPATFVSPWQNPVSDTTSLAQFPSTEGLLKIAPSWALHFVPPNTSDKQRVVVAFDFLPELPQHQAIK